MKLFIKSFFKSLFFFSSQFGFNPKKLIFFKNYSRFRKDRKEWIKKGGIITHNYMMLSDYDSNAGNANIADTAGKASFAGCASLAGFAGNAGANIAALAGHGKPRPAMASKY